LKYNGLLKALGTFALAAGILAAAHAENLSGAGSTFIYPILSKWTSVYAQRTGVQINYQSIGSGGGIQQLKARTVDFGASDAALSNAEAKEMPGPVAHIPLTAGAVVVSYNVPGLQKGLNLDGPTLAAIFMGRIRKWNDPHIRALNKGVALPGQAIAVTHRSDGSGTSFIFTNYLASVSPAWKNGVGAGKSVNWPVGLGGKGNEGVAGLIRHISGSIGYVELAYALQNHLPFADIKNAAGKFVTPTTQSTSAGLAGALPRLKKDVRSILVNPPGANSYPIIGVTYVLAYRNMSGSKAAELKKFLSWANSAGQQYADDLHYAPLPPAVINLNAKTIDSIK
jgi:phosphate transport system substrate-binding protein